MIFTLSGGVGRVKDSLWTIAQIVLAATTAYLIARFGLGHPVPLLAVTVAISSLGLSRDTRPDRVLTTAVAMVLGIALSEAMLIMFGSGAPQLFFAMASALLLARLISQNPAFALTVTLQAVLVQLLQEPSGGVFARALDGMIGGAIALGFTALLPRNPIKLSRSDSRALFRAFKQTLEDIRSVLKTPDVQRAEEALERIRNTQPIVDNWRGSLESARAIVKISPFYRWAHKEIAAQRVLFEGMDLATRNLRVVARRVDYLTKDGKPRKELADLVSKVLTGVELLANSAEDFSIAPKARKYVAKLARQLDPKLFSAELTTSEVSVLMQFRPMVVDLCQAAGIDAVTARELLPKVD